MKSYFVFLSTIRIPRRFICCMMTKGGEIVGHLSIGLFTIMRFGDDPKYLARTSLSPSPSHFCHMIPNNHRTNDGKYMIIFLYSSHPDPHSSNLHPQPPLTMSHTGFPLEANLGQFCSLIRDFTCATPLSSSFSDEPFC